MSRHSTLNPGMLLTAQNCPDRAKHTKAPTNYIGWNDWAEKKSKTHRQIKCRTCGLYTIWVPKKKRVKK